MFKRTNSPGQPTSSRLAHIKPPLWDDSVSVRYSWISTSDECPEHYVSPIANSTSHTLTEAIEERRTSDTQTNKYTCCPWTFCLNTDPEGWECLELINCDTAPDHFKNKHGITNMGREVELVCVWQGCGRQVIRHNYIRHIREHHLQHHRELAHANQAVVRMGG
ncbi:hypothetical protein EDC04DRAFT_1248615 [Pisolithus marmoratus]|nr:hypothetical protein EDC04DRAFT_1248615 [Pisolithus marmoratus]